MEARFDEKHHQWLRPEEICEVLGNPPAIMPPKDGKSIEEVDREKDEEGNDTNRVRKRPKVSRGQKSHEFAGGEVMCSLEELHELLHRASAPNTLAGSSISNPTIDLQAIATIRATLEMDFIAMAGEVQLTRMISGIQSLVDSNCFPAGTRTMIMGLLKQVEQYDPAYSKAYSEYVEKRKCRIEARQAAILAEIHGAIKETEPIQAQLEKLLLQQDQFKENENNLKTILDIGDGL